MDHKFISLHPLNTAVLFIIFNRLDTAKEVFTAIRKAQPPRLYIASDGARVDKEGEEMKVQMIRNYLIEHIDWDCEVKTLFREKNFSCGPSVKGAIDWFFSFEEDGIILEDDVVPSQSFFWYCEELLERYRDDFRVGMINGTNHIGFLPREDSYLFSKYKSGWGWATWKRAWFNMDLEMNWSHTEFHESIVLNMGHSEKNVNFWERIIHRIELNQVSAWDYQWAFSLGSQNQLGIVPRRNLIANIGFGDDATHTIGSPKDSYITSEEIELPLKHPPYILPNSDYDSRYETILINARWKRFIPKFIRLFLIKIKSKFIHT